MSVNSTDEYFELLEKSGVLSESELEGAKTHFAESTDAREVARQLVNGGILTDWQARFLMSGRHSLNVGQYCLVDRLPKQASGDRFVAVHKKLDRTVNVLILPKRANQNQKVLKTFLEQAAMVAELDHPNLLHVYDIDKENDRYFVVFENQTGVSLKSLPPKSLTPQQVGRITSEALAGVLYAHERGLLHGKLDETQICVDPKHTVKVLGFGVAKLLDQLADPDGEPDEFAIESDASDDLAALGRTAKLLYRDQIGQPLTAPQKDLFAILSDLENVTEVKNNEPQGLLNKLDSWLKVQQQSEQQPQAPSPQSKRKPAKTTANPKRNATQRANQKLWIVIAAGFLVIAAIGVWYLLSGADSEPAAQNVTSPSLAPIPTAKVPAGQEVDENSPQEQAPKGLASEGTSPELPPVTDSSDSSSKDGPDTDRDGSLEKRESKTEIPNDESQGTNLDSDKTKTPPPSNAREETNANSTVSTPEVSGVPSKSLAVNADISELKENKNSILLNFTKKLNIKDPYLKSGANGYQGPDLFLAFQKDSTVAASAGVAIPPESGYRLRFDKGVAGQKAFALHLFKTAPIDLTDVQVSDELMIKIRGLKKEKFNSAHLRLVIRDGEQFYISKASQNLSVGDEEYINPDIKHNALTMNWYSYDPVAGRLDNFSGPLQKPLLKQINFVGFLIYAERSTPANGGANFGVRAFQAFKGAGSSAETASSEIQEEAVAGPPQKVYLEGSEGLPLVPWDKAAEFDGQEIVVYGNVVSVRSSGTGKTRYLEFVKDDKSRFKIAIRQSQLPISEEELSSKFLNQPICLRGKVQKFMSNPEILLTAMNQVVVVSELPGPDTAMASEAPRVFNAVESQGAFAGMPPGVAIPEITRSPIDTKPVLLGPVKVNDDPLGIFLTVPDVASPKSMSLNIERDQTGKRWEISYAGKSDPQPSDFQPVAEIQLRDNELFFNWMTLESQDLNLNYLQNCLLDIKTPDEAKTILLRKPVIGQPIRLDEKRGSFKEKLDLQYLPKPESISVEFLELPKAQFPEQISETGMTASQSTPETILYFDLLLQNRFFRLIHNVEINRQIKIDSALQINQPNKPLVYTPRNIKDLEKKLTNRQLQINQTNQAALQYAPPNGEKTKHKELLKNLSKELEMINGQVLAFQSSLPIAQAALKAEMKYRIYFSVGDVQFNLLIPETAAQTVDSSEQE